LRTSVELLKSHGNRRIRFDHHAYARGISISGGTSNP
jgi:hypothetical protein